MAPETKKNLFIYRWTDLFFKTKTEKLNYLKHSRFERFDLVKILDAQKLIFTRLSQGISLKKNLFI